jgi:copper chaperone CopZ
MTKLWTLAAGALCAAVVAGCGTTTTSSSFKGAEHEAAQTIGNLQTYATANEASKICSQLLSKSTVEGLGGHDGCEAAIKSQLKQVDSFELATKSVQVNGDHATAKVESLVSGKKKVQQVSLTKEGSSWKITALE